MRILTLLCVVAASGAAAAGCGSSSTSSPSVGHTHKQRVEAPKQRVEAPPIQDQQAVSADLSQLTSVGPLALLTHAEAAWGLNLRDVSVGAGTDLAGRTHSDVVDYYDSKHADPHMTSVENGSSSIEIYLDFNPSPGEKRVDYVQPDGKIFPTGAGLPSSDQLKRVRDAILIEAYSTPDGWHGWISDQSAAKQPSSLRRLMGDLVYVRGLMFSAVKGNLEMFIGISWQAKPGTEQAPVSSLPTGEEIARLKALANVFTSRFSAQQANRNQGGD